MTKLAVHFATAHLLKLAGAVILGVGIWVKVDSGSLLGLLNSVEGAPPELSQLTSVAYVLIGVGAVLVVIGFLGCCGAIRESRCMLLTFFSIVLIIFLIEVAGAVVLFVFKDFVGEIFDDLEDEVKKSLQENYGDNDDNGLTSLWNTTMEELKCCGFKNYTDFDGSPFNTANGGGFYPQMCCNANSTAAQCNEEEAHFSNIEGCFNKLLQLIEDNAIIIAAVALGITALEIAAMVVSMVLYSQIGKKA